YLFPLAFDDPCPNLFGRLALFVLRVRVDDLFHASGALRTVSIFKTGVQAVVTHAVAIAIAGLLMKYGWNFCRQLVGVSLKWVPTIFSPKLFFGQNGRQFGTRFRWSRVVSWHACVFLLERPLAEHRNCHNEKESHDQSAFQHGRAFLALL